MGDELTNAALADLRFLVGEWDMALSNASFLADPEQVVAGTVEFTPIEDGMLLAMHQRGDAGPSLASWVIGRDGGRTGYTVLYTDGRGVSRVYEMSLTDHRWTIWRDDPDFSQRFTAEIDQDRDRISGRWEKRSHAGSWEHDFDLAYTRRP